MAGRPAVAASSKWLDGFRKWYYNAAGFNKLGLMRDDIIHETEDVKEAIRRLPENLYNDRMFRIKRALDLTMRHQILPKEQWTKYEEDKFYLEPYLKEIHSSISLQRRADLQDITNTAKQNAIRQGKCPHTEAERGQIFDLQTVVSCYVDAEI
ncbi:hypothetical protein STEG23_035689 [Scotinomys teguina]